jgi:hypothetical protein
MGREEIESDPERARAYVGATILADAIHELRLIRRLLTPKE